MKLYRAYTETPLGWIEISASEEGIVSLLFDNKIRPPLQPTSPEEQPEILKEALRQVAEWFEGKRFSFTLPLHLQGTAFQRRVWEEIIKIPFGETSTYARMAHRLGQPAAIRAVAYAIGRNPLNIIIPCHRVVGSRGQLTGYGGELWRKAWLLRFEQEIAGQRLRYG